MKTDRQHWNTCQISPFLLFGISKVLCFIYLSLCCNSLNLDTSGHLLNVRLPGTINSFEKRNVYNMDKLFQCISNKMQRYTVYLYLETALHVSGGTSTHHQEHTQLYLQHLVLVKPLLLPAAIVEELELRFDKCQML